MAFLKKGNGMIKSLGQMVGLLLGLYVFDQIISVILPLSYNCLGSTTAKNGTPGYGDWTANTTGQECYTTNGTSTQVTDIPSSFGTALTFIQNLFPVIGIMGAFEIIYRGLRSSGMI